MSSFEERVARNEARARAHNEWIEDQRIASRSHPAFTDWICECAREMCPESVEMSIGEYEAVRADGTYFVVAPAYEHVAANVERVVKRTDRYWVVEKNGVAGRISEDLDGRSNGSESA